MAWCRAGLARRVEHAHGQSAAAGLEAQADVEGAVREIHAQDAVEAGRGQVEAAAMFADFVAMLEERIAVGGRDAKRLVEDEQLVAGCNEDVIADHGDPA